MHAKTRRTGARLATRRGAALIAVVALSGAFAPAVLADGATITRGDFAAFATGAGLGITGRAQMVRTADGRTIVSIQLEGLDPNLSGGLVGEEGHQLLCEASERRAVRPLVPQVGQLVGDEGVVSDVDVHGWKLSAWPGIPRLR